MPMRHFQISEKTILIFYFKKKLIESYSYRKMIPKRGKQNLWSVLDPRFWHSAGIPERFFCKN